MPIRRVKPANLYLAPVQKMGVTSYIYDVPSLTERVAITRVRNIVPTEVVRLPDTFSQEINIEKKTATTPPMLLVTSSERAEKKYSLEPGNPDPLPVETPWIRDEKALEARKLAAAPKMLRLQFVDSEGNPIAGARVTGEERSVKWDTSSEVVRVNLTADAEGRIAHAVSGDRINLKVHAQSYDTESLGYHRRELPENEVQVMLLREGVRVPLRVVSQRPQVWRENADVYEIGLQFGPSSTPSDRARWVEQKTVSDIWFVAEKTMEIEVEDSVVCENSEAWTVTMEGHNGWDLLEGPHTEDWRAVIQEAPAEGYVKTVAFVGECNVRDINVYLRYNDGERYGLLTGLQFADKSKTGNVLRWLVTGVVLQMEGSGRRSLDAR